MSESSIVKLDCPFATVLLRWDGNEEARNVAMRSKACSKEPWTTDFIRQLPEGAVFVDVGANIGSYSLLAAKLGHPVVAIEPGYANYHHLMRNAMLNQIEERVLGLQVALGDQVGLDYLHFGDLLAGSASHKFGQPVPGDVAWKFHRQPVMVWPYDVLWEMLKLPEPHFIKIDVDGAESAVLKGMPKALSVCRAVMLEMKLDGEAGLVELMKSHGLELSARFDERDGKKIGGIAYGFFQRVVPAESAPTIEGNVPEVVAAG